MYEYESIKSVTVNCYKKEIAWQKRNVPKGKTEIKHPPILQISFIHFDFFSGLYSWVGWWWESPEKTLYSW